MQVPDNTGNTDQEKKIKKNVRSRKGQNEKNDRAIDVVSRCILIFTGVLYNYNV